MCGAWDDPRDPGGDVLVFHRNGEYRNLERLRAARESGVVVVADEDDHLYAPRASTAGRSGGHVWNDLVLNLFQTRRVPSGIDRALQRVGEQVLEGIARCSSAEEALRVASSYHPLRVHAETLREATLVTTASHSLASFYGRFNASTRALPNCVDLTEARYQPANRQVPHDGIVVGWAGGREHLEDLRLIHRLMEEIVQEYDGKYGKPLVRFMIGGSLQIIETWFLAVPGMGELVDHVKARSRDAPWLEYSVPPWHADDVLIVEAGRHLYRPSAPVTTYPLMYCDVDIGIVPNCLGRAFQEARSDVKGLEMAAMGVPIVASPTSEYRRWRPHGTGAWLPTGNNLKAWGKALRTLIKSAALRQQMADEALAFAQTRSIDRWIPNWLAAYQEAADGRLEPSSHHETVR